MHLHLDYHPDNHYQGLVPRTIDSSHFTFVTV